MKRLLSLALSLCLCLSLLVLPAAAFTDVPAAAWYAGPVEFVRSRGIMKGTSDTAFSPTALTSRGMMAAILHRCAGSPHSTAGLEFMDISAGTWYIDSVIWCAEKNIITGTSPTAFSPNLPLTREQVAVMLWRYAQWPQVAGNPQDFADQSQISSWALTAVRWARSAHIIAGKPGNRFDPQGTATRAEVAQMVQNYFSWAAK